MGAQQQVIAGTLNASQVAALRAREYRDDLEVAKIRYNRALEKLEQSMLDDGLSEVYAKGTRFRRDIVERVKVEGYTKPELSADDAE
jgi:hypothetical protein